MILRFCLTFIAMTFAVALATSPSPVLAGDDGYSSPPPPSEGTYSEPETYQEPQGDSLPGDDATPPPPTDYAPDGAPPPPDAPQ
jgi:hypothetical protein